MTKRSKALAATGETETLSIGALSRATRIPVETLRTWEHRYGSPMPIRKPSGHRVYAPTAVEQLRRVGRLLAHGHRPGEILRLSLPELDRLLSLSQEGAPASAGVPAPEPADVAATQARLERLMRSMLDLNRPALVQELQSSWARLGPLRCLEDVVGAFLTRVGRAWSDGEAEVRHEHFAFACVADFLRSVREPFDQQARGAHVVATTLPGETHEGGLLMASVLLAVHGYRVLYLGLGTPLAQLPAAAKAVDAEAVVVSVSAAIPSARANREVLALRKSLPRRLPLWVGGAGAPPAGRGVERFATLSALDRHLIPTE